MIARIWIQAVEPARASEYLNFARRYSLPMFRLQVAKRGAAVSRLLATASESGMPSQVKRHTIVDSFSLQTGRHIASRYQPGLGIRPFSGVILAIS